MKMEILNGKILNNFNLDKVLIRIADIVNFEGPLLTLYENIENSRLYLIDWVDRDSQFNRWLIYQCHPKTLYKFIKKQISHYDLFISDENQCIKIDIDKNLVWRNPILLNKTNLSKNYQPEKDVFFEECDCPNLAKLNTFVRAKTLQKQENIYVNQLNIQNIETSIPKKIIIYPTKYLTNRTSNFDISNYPDVIANIIDYNMYSHFENKSQRKKELTKKINSYV